LEKGFDGFTQVVTDLIDRDGVFSVPTHTGSKVGKSQPVFQQSFTPSDLDLGAYPNYVLGRSDFERSLHPTHSVAAWGSRAEDFVKTPATTPCPPEGPYGKLRDWNGKIVFLGVNLIRCTYFHCLEEVAGCGEIWSLEKEPIQQVLISSANKVTFVRYRGHHRGNSDHYYRIESDLLAEGLLLQGFVGPAPVKILDAGGAANWLVPRLVENPNFFF